MENKVIILGVNHESTLGLVRCFGEAGIKPICILYGSKKGLVFSSKYPSVKHYERTPEDGLRFIIENYKGIAPKPFLFGSNDKSASVINENYNRLKNYFFVESAKGTEGEIVRLMDKWIIYRVAEEHGLKVAKTFLLKKNDEIPNSIEYPVFTKSMRTIDGGKSDEKICNDKFELEAFLKSCNANNIMVQKYIEKKLEFNYYGFACENTVYISYENHRPRFSESALGGYHLFVPTNKNSLYEKVMALMKDTGYEGLFSVEFLVDKNDVYYFMEVNFRHDGDTYLLMPGINLPLQYCKRVLHEECRNISLKKKIVGMREDVDYLQQVKTGKMSKTRWLKDFILADSHILCSIRDMAPFLYFIKQRVFNKTSNDSASD